MSLIAFCSLKGSPGVTTAAQAVAAVAARVAATDRPPEGKALLVEADPFGGDLAARYGARAPHGLAGLFAAARHGVASDTVWEHTELLPDDLSVLFGMAGPSQAMANEGTWPVIATALAELGCDVIVDVGRLLPNFGGGVSEIFGQADTVVLLCSPTLDSIVHVRAALPALTNAVGTHRLLVAPTATNGYAAPQIEKTLQVKLGRPIPYDPPAVAALFAGHANKLAKTRLGKWATAMVADLGLATSPPPLTATEADRAALHPTNRKGPTSDHAVSQRGGTR